MMRENKPVLVWPSRFVGILVETFRLLLSVNYRVIASVLIYTRHHKQLLLRRGYLSDRGLLEC